MLRVLSVELVHYNLLSKIDRDAFALGLRSAPLPTGGHIEQSDGTGWMATYSLHLLAIALELAQASGGRPSREMLTAELARRSTRDLKGWRVEFREDRRGSRFVTHTLLASDGRLVG